MSADDGHSARETLSDKELEPKHCPGGKSAAAMRGTDE
jgi:hypothetical protein